MRKDLRRVAARDSGDPTYIPEKACKHGHLGPRSTATGACLPCMRGHGQKHYAKKIDNPERAAARAAGAKHFSGRPCVHGHDLRFVSNNQCVRCDRAVTDRYRGKNPGLEAKWARERRAKDPTGHRNAAKKWWQANRERAKATLARWKAANPDRMKALARVGTERRRTKVAANGGDFTIADIEAIFERQEGRCLVCPTTRRLEIDHIMPICLGGSSDPENLQLLCSTCNKSKGGKHPDVWRKSLTKQ